VLEGNRIIITGLTGQVAKPVAMALAEKNEVFGLARFSNSVVRAELESSAVKCVTVDFADADFAQVPTDVDYVLNFAVAKTSDFDADISANVEGLGLLLSHCSDARAVLHCSSTAVYQPNGHHRFAEGDPLGDNHRVETMSFMPTYSTVKIAAEAMARFAARQFDLPTVIARLNVPYGPSGGWMWLHLEQVLAGQPVTIHPDAPNEFNPIHDDDIRGMVPGLLNAASVPATVVNWAGTETVSVEEWVGYMGELTGRPVGFEPITGALESVAVDTTRMVELVGPTSTEWRDGVQSVIEHFHPELLAR
jgi:nucleoside-diphosphate-sugar epimerase